MKYDAIKRVKALFFALALIMSAAVGAACVATDAGGGDTIIYTIGNLDFAVAGEYVDRLIVSLGDGGADERIADTTLISVYEKASQDAAVEDGMSDASVIGWLFSIVRYDRVQYEKHLGEDGSGLDFFAVGDGWYYGYCHATDVRFYRSGEAYFDESALAEWSLLNLNVGQSVKDDFIVRNGVLPYSDDVIRNGFTYESEHLYVNYYPYYSIDGNRDSCYTFVLSQPAEQGESGVWCVERMTDNNGNEYLCFPDAGIPAEEYYAQLQSECNGGQCLSSLEPMEVAREFAVNSGYWHNTMPTEGSLEIVPG